MGVGLGELLSVYVCMYLCCYVLYFMYIYVKDPLENETVDSV